MSDNMILKLMLSANDKMSGVIRGAVLKSDREFEKMQKRISNVAGSIDKIGDSMLKAGGILTAGGATLAHSLKMTNAIADSFTLEHRLRALGNTGGLTNEKMEYINRQLERLAPNTNKFKTELMDGVEVLVASGFAADKAINYMEAIGKTSTAAGAEIKDTAITVFTLADNLKVPVNEIQRSLDVLNQSGKEGRFELKAMAAEFPALTASAAALGMKGVPAVAQLGASLQVAMKGAGSESEAANNLANFMRAITSPLVKESMQKQWGVNIEEVLKNAAKNGKDPIMEVIALTKKATGGNMFKVGGVFRDAQVQNFIKPMMQNLEEYNRIKGVALSSDGNVERDYQAMMTTTIEQWRELQINMQKIVFPHLAAPLKAVNGFLKDINKNPILQKGIFSAIVGSIGVGLVLTGLGLATKAVAGLTQGYGDFLEGYRNTVRFIHKNKFLSETFSNLANPIKGIKTLDGSLRGMASNSMQNLSLALSSMPSNIIAAKDSLALFGAELIRTAPEKFAAGLNAFKGGFSKMPMAIGNVVKGIWSMNVALLTSPLLWAGVAIAGAAIMIIKYWNPIKGFFRGLWAGIVAGTAPLHPMFQKIGKAVKPLIDWFKKLVTPINSAGKGAESFGFKVGKAIGGAITWLAKLAKKVWDVIKWTQPLYWIFRGGKWVIEARKGAEKPPKGTPNPDKKPKPDGSYFDGLDRVPFDGFVAETHKDEMIVPAKQAKSLRQGSLANNGISLTFTIDEGTLDSSDDGDSYIIRALAASINDKIREKVSKPYEGKTLIQIAKEIGRKHGFTVAGKEGFIKLPRVAQYKESDLAFLRRISEQFGYIFKLNDTVLTFTKIESLEESKALQTLKRKDIKKLTLNDTSTKTYSSCKVEYFNAKKGKYVGVTAKNKKSGVKNETLKLNIKCKTKEEALAKANAGLKAGQITVEGSIELKGGNRYCIAGANFNLEEYESFNGKYHITQSIHDFTPDNYESSAEVKRVA